MNITLVIENIKNFFVSLFAKIKTIFEEDKKRFLIISGIALLILILLIILIFSPKQKNDKNISQMFSLSEKIVIPPSPEIKNDYTLTRENNKKWVKEEGEEYFTTPSKKEINSLSDSNDTLISNMIGAAPWKSPYLYYP